MLHLSECRNRRDPSQDSIDPTRCLLQAFCAASKHVLVKISQVKMCCVVVRRKAWNNIQTSEYSEKLTLTLLQHTTARVMTIAATQQLVTEMMTMERILWSS